MNLGKPIVIICEDAEQEGLAFLAMNTLEKRIECCIVTAPAYGELRRETMEDIALITGGAYISDIRGVNIKEINEMHFGSASKVIISKDETLIVEGTANKEKVEELLNELRMNLTQAKDEDEKYPIENRIAALTGNIAVIEVGATTDSELREKLDRYDDATRATKAAIEEGFVSGGGSALFNVNSQTENAYQAVLLGILGKPFEQICLNSGLSDINIQEIVDEILEEENEGFGYNANNGKVEDLIKAGIIDPTKVVRCSIQNAASAAGMILTAECIIADSSY